MAPRPPAVALSIQYLPAAPPPNKLGVEAERWTRGALWDNPRHAPDKPTGLPAPPPAGRGGARTRPCAEYHTLLCRLLPHPGQVVTLNLAPVPFHLRVFAPLFLPQAPGMAASGQPSHSTEQQLQPFLWSFWPACSLQATGCGQGPLCPVAPSTHSRGPGTCHTCSLLKQGPKVGSLGKSPTCQAPAVLLRGHKARKCPHAEAASRPA